MPNAIPHTNINLQEVSARNDNARHIVAGFASAMPALATSGDTSKTRSTTRSRSRRRSPAFPPNCSVTRLDRANLLAAMRATLAAHADGEPDPMWYLRDALDAPETPPCRLAEASMTTYRRMRRQARQARRSGLQPMMVINSGEPFPETAGVVLLRWAWRYRSELAPLGVTVGIVCAAWWLHAARPHWWAVILGIAAVAAVGPGCLRREVRTGRADRAPVCGHHRACGRRVDCRRNRARPVHVAAPASPGHRRG